MVETSQQPEIATATRRDMVGIVRDYTLDTRHGIPGQWQAYFAAAPDIDNAVAGAMYGASFSADGQGGFRYAVGVEVSKLPDSLPEGCCPVRLSGGKHAVMRVFGPISGLPGVMDWMFNDWLPGSDWRQRDGAVFERYPDDPRNGDQGMAYEIWMPVAKRPKRKG